VAQRLIAHGVDLERLAAHVVRRFLSSHVEHVDDLEDWVAEATLRAWVLALEFDPRIGTSFDGWASRRLRFYCIERVRTTVADHRYPNQVEARLAVSQPLSLDDTSNGGPLGTSLEEWLSDDAGSAADAYERRAGLDQADSDPPLRWLFNTRDSSRDTDLALLAEAVARLRHA
jgi:DNA-directed RNA polymerase specialized sigma24 family protein